MGEADAAIVRGGGQSRTGALTRASVKLLNEFCSGTRRLSLSDSSVNKNESSEKCGLRKKTLSRRESTQLKPSFRLRKSPAPGL
jgi:hypothetical protein